MKFERLSIPDVVVVTPDIFRDHRGIFFEGFRTADFVANEVDISTKIVPRPDVAGLEALLQEHGQSNVRLLPNGDVTVLFGFVQGNVSMSGPWTVRGLHYGMVEPQGKLVRCTHGSIFDVAVDMRQSSPTFGTWVGRVLDDCGHEAIWVPPGFAHGFVSLDRGATVVYECSSYHRKDSDRALRWDDPALGISWPIPEVILKQAVGGLVISEKDKNAPLFADAEKLP